MPNYIALTMGPIVRSLSNAQKTRELWAASYTFSWLMKQIAIKLQNDSGSQNRTFIMPFEDDGKAESPYRNFDQRGVHLHGAGIFPDRIIFETTNQNDLVQTREVVLGQIKELAGDIEKVLQNVSAQVAQNYLTEYLNVHFIERFIPDPDITPGMDEEKKAEALGKANPILVLSPILDALEQQKTFPPIFQNILIGYWPQVSLSRIKDTDKPVSKLARDAFGKARLLDKQTLEHIALSEFMPIIDQRPSAAKEEDSGELILEYEKRPNFIPAHKYVAVVQADGDNVGKTIAALKPNQFQRFSHLLKDFSVEAVKLIADFGGLTVYAGGDDLLFFAPIVNRQSIGDSKNIFALLRQLDSLFQQKMQESGIEYGDKRPQPTLSFGLSIAYYKFPLYESLAAGRRLLFGVAKDEKLNPDKHTIAFEIRKHSGSTFGGRLQLGATAVATAYQGLLDTLFQPPNEQLLASVSYKLRRERELVNLFAKEKDRLAAYLDNSFNEKVHRIDPQKAFLQEMKAFIPAVYQEFEIAEEEGKDLKDDDPRWPHNQLFGLIRSLQFLTDEPND